MLLECASVDSSSLSLSDGADIANIIIALFNLALAWYLFVYQKNKDKKSDEESRVQKNESLLIQEQSIRLQWFKELIIQPNLNNILSFYSGILKAARAIQKAGITDAEKIEITEYIKEEFYSIRRTFVDVVKTVNPQLGAELQKNIEDLLDKVITTISDESIKSDSEFEKLIATPITYSKNDLIAKIYNYKGA